VNYSTTLSARLAFRSLPARFIAVDRPALFAMLKFGIDVTTTIRRPSTSSR